MGKKINALSAGAAALLYVALEDSHNEYIYHLMAERGFSDREKIREDRSYLMAQLLDVIKYHEETEY